MYWPIFFRNTSLALEQSYCGPSASEAILTDMVKSVDTKAYSGAVIMQSNISWYYVQHYSDSDKHKSDFQLTEDTPYLALMGEIWGVCCEDFGEDKLCYNGIALYKQRA